MRKIRVLFLLSMFAIFALLTMAPHFRTFDNVRFDVTVTGSGQFSGSVEDGRFHGVANVVITGGSGEDRRLNSFGKMRVVAKCISPVCGGVFDIQGETRFERDPRDAGAIEGDGQGTFRGTITDLKRSEDPDGTITIGFTATGVLNARISTLE